MKSCRQEVVRINAAQAEQRVAASYIPAEEALKFDKHTMRAAGMFGVHPDDVTIVQRNLAKQAAYNEMYGNEPEVYTPITDGIIHMKVPLLAKLFGTKIVAREDGFKTTMYVHKGKHYISECIEVGYE